MLTRHQHGSVTWVDLESPTADELASVVDEFALDERVVDEIRLPTPYPLYLSAARYQYLILHFPTAAAQGGAREQEVDFIVGKKFLVTVRYEVVDSIQNLHRVFEAEELLGIPPTAAKADKLLERVLRRLYGAIRHEVEHAARRIDRIERAIFSGHERETVRHISDVGRILQRFETTVSRHEEPLSAFVKALGQPQFFGTAWAEHASHVEAERAHAHALVSSYRAVAIELRETNDSLLSASQNEVMKTLTVITFVMLPLTLVAALFQMGLPGTPLMSEPNAFWIVIAAMLVISGLIGGLVVKKRWL
jgi:magnesium transporter